MQRSWYQGFPAGLTIVALAVYGSIFALGFWAYQFQVYHPVMDSLGTRFWQQPFFDLEGVLSWGECHRLGYDVMRVNPCDPEGRLLNYSPLTQYLPFGTKATMLEGLIIVGAFLFTVPWVLRPRTWREMGFALAAVLCPFSVGFALERANLDVVIFVAAAAGVWLTAQTAFLRQAGYVLYLALGLMKFYPLILLGTLARERPRAALLAVASSAAVVVLFAVFYWSDLIRIPALLPPPRFTRDNFGAVILPLATMHTFGWPAAGAVVMQLVLTLAAFVAGARLSIRIRPLVAEDRLGVYPFAFLIVGALLIAGAFFAQTNIAYRAIFLLFLLPGLFRLEESPGKDRWIFSLTLAAMFLCLWEAIFRLPLNLASASFAGSGALGFFLDRLAGAFFLLREAAWWWIVTVLLAVLVSFFRQARAVQAGIVSARGWARAFAPS